MTSLRQARKTSLDVFCMAHPEHFERPHHSTTTQAGTLTVPLPDTWRRGADADWSYCSPPEDPSPEQGWKIHVSALPADALDTLNVCARICIGREVPFKHLRSTGLVEAHNGKYAARASSGKFVTIYPPDEEALLTLLDELDDALGSRSAPYILSDLRWRRGPVHVRYGAFHHLECHGNDGQPVAAVRRPDGVLVPDLRVPWLEIPSWAPVPEPLARMRDATVVAPPSTYHFEEALHFSNGGGVYAGRRTSDNKRVVLKEARPCAGLDSRGGDAVSRLLAETTALRALSGLPGVPEILDAFELWEHHFLVTAHHGSLTFQSWLAAHHPSIKHGATKDDYDQYADRALRIVGTIAKTIAAIHERGWTFGDLHPGNILVAEDDEVTLIDYELATPTAAPRRAGLACPGFVRGNRQAKEMVTPADDTYALASLALWCLAPMSQMIPFEPGLATQYADWARRRWNVPQWWDALVNQHLTTTPDGPTAKGEDQPADIVAALAQGVLASLTPERPDLLVPGDILALLGDGAQLGTGAAGVIWAFDAVGVAVPPSARAWLEDQAEAVRGPGLYDGRAGVAHTMWRWDPTRAVSLLTGAVEKSITSQDPTVYSGRAGVGLAALRRGRVDDAVALADGILELGVADVDTATGSGAGFMDGWAGVAAFLARVGVATGDQHWLNLAQEAGHRDHETCVVGDDGALLVQEGSIRYPYLAHGSAGLLIAHGELVRAGSMLLTPAEAHAVVRGMSVDIVAEPGLLNGRAGLMIALEHAHRCGVADTRAITAHHAAYLRWYLVRRGGGVLVPGRGLRRLSGDFATGAAGVMLAAAAVRSPTPLLPGLETPL